jgi:hypothetical protein
VEVVASAASNSPHAKATNGRGGRIPEDESAFAINSPSARASDAMAPDLALYLRRLVLRAPDVQNGPF